MTKSVKKGKTLTFMVAILLFAMIPPYFFWHNIYSSNYAKMLITFAIAVFFFLNRSKWEWQEKGLFMLFLASLILYTITGDNNINFFVYTLPVVFIPFAKDFFTRNVYVWFSNIYVFIIAIGLVVWLMAMMGLVSSMGTIPPLNELKMYNYTVYPFMVSIAGESLLRFHGPFDEPGVVGTLSGLMLCIEGFNLKKKKTLILLFSGICSLSFFFVIIVSFYTLYSVVFREKSVLKLMLLMAIFFGLYLTINNVPVLQENLGSRFEWDADESQLAGDNRINTVITATYFDHIIGTSQLWWGIKDKQRYLMDVEGSSSIISTIIVNGLVFILVYIVFIVLYAIRYKSNNATFALFLLVILGTLYQRPQVFNAVYVFLFICFARTDRIKNSLSSCHQNV